MRTVFLWRRVTKANEEGMGPEAEGLEAPRNSEECGWKRIRFASWGSGYHTPGLQEHSTSVLHPSPAEARIPRIHEDTSNF